MKIVVAGAAGHLGATIVHELSPAHQVVPFTRSELDVTDAAAVRDAVSSANPAAVINCTAYNDVDGAEDDPITAFNVNAFGVQALARASAEVGALFLHFSTDFVFSGDTARPYTEEDRPGPLGVYGASKLVGEWLAREAPRHYVLRVESLFGGPHGQGRSVSRIVDAIEAGREVPVFVDRVVSPTSVVQLAAATGALLEKELPGGVYHAVNGGACRWDELALEVARYLGREARLKPITLADVSLKARRPRFCALSNQKLASAGIVMDEWRDALRQHLADRRRS
jgi:dTDP-4-dehydrorhamnose reductase